MTRVFDTVEHEQMANSMKAEWIKLENRCDKLMENRSKVPAFLAAAAASAFIRWDAYQDRHSILQGE